MAADTRTAAFLAVGLAAFVAWQAAVLAGLGRRVAVALGLLGFVLHVVFAKGYTLVPSYFARRLQFERLPYVHLACSASGTVALALAAAGVRRPTLGAAGGALWLAGVVLFVGMLAWTLRGNPTGRETGTGDARAAWRPVDRVANLAAPVALAYLLAGSYALAAPHLGLPTVFDGYPPRATHLLAAGGAAVLVVAVGFRLFGRLLGVRPPLVAALVVVPAAALGPVLVAATLPAGPWFPVAAAVEAVGVVGFAATYLWLFWRSSMRRAGHVAVALACLAGVAGVALGVHAAVAGPTGGTLAAHARLNLLGFLGLTVVGATYLFYPPTSAQFVGGSERTAFAAVALLAGGLAVEAGAHAVGPAGLTTALVTAGRAVAFLGALGYAGLVGGMLRQQRRS